jgi:hypothetical protein
MEEVPSGFEELAQAEASWGKSGGTSRLRTGLKNEMKNEISHQFRKFLAFSEFFWHFFSRSLDILSFPEHSCEIPAKFHQDFAEKSQNSSKNANEMKFQFFIPTKF